jgi:hypothetical protein
MLGWLEWWWLGVFMALSTILAVGWLLCRWAHQTVRWCTRHSTVHCPMCATSADRWGLERLTVEVICSFPAPDSPVRPVVDCLLTSGAADCAQSHSQPLGEVDRCSVVSSDSLVAHRTVWWILAVERQEFLRAASSRSTQLGYRTVSGAPQAVAILFCSKHVEFSQGYFPCIFMWTLYT